jgi:NTE family protein
MINRTGKTPAKRLVVISVNASTGQKKEFDESRKQPSMLASMNAMTDIQLHRYNAATVDLVERDLSDWAAQMSRPGHRIDPYFISQFV